MEIRVAEKNDIRCAVIIDSDKVIKDARSALDLLTVPCR